jgi:hypothetical protein
MTRRWRLWMSLALVLVAIATLLHPAAYWPILGWLRGEAFYKGRPTTHWSQEIERWYQGTDHKALRMYRGDLPQPPPPVTTFEHIKAFSGYWPQPQRRHPLPQNDALLVPVLRQLLKDQNLMVRVQAMATLWELGPDARPAWPELIEALNDKEGNASYWAVQVLERIDPVEAGKVIPDHW